MKRLYFASLNNCNEKCLFCVRGGEEPLIENMNTKTAKSVLTQKFKEGYEEVYFDGGEPTLRPDLGELIKHAKKTGYKSVNILTNGVVLSNKKLAKDLLQIKNSKNFSLSFSVSLHSHKKTVSEKLVGKKNTFEKTLAGIANLIKNGAQNLSLYHIITNHNYKDLPGFVSFVHKKFPQIKNITFSFVYPAGAALENNKIYPQLSKIEPYFKKAADLCKKNKIDFSLSTCGTVPLCFLPGHEDVLLKQQNLDQPDKVGLVDADKDTQYQLATQEFHKKTKIKSSKCSECVYDDKCGGIWKTYVEVYGIDELKPVLKNEKKNAKKPTVMLLLTGFSCNNNCVFCSNVADRKFNSSTKKLKEKIKEGYNSGFRIIEFIGGEVSIRPDFFELLTCAKNTGFDDIRLTTNARLFSYPVFLKKAIDAGLKVVVVSLYGHTKALHEAVTRAPGSFEQCVEGLENLSKQKKTELIVNTVVSKINYKHLYDIGNFVSGFGVKEWHPLELLPDGRAEKLYHALAVPYGELSCFIKKSTGLAGKKIKRIDYFDFPFCIFEKNMITNENINFFTPRLRFEDIEMHAHDESTRVEKKKEGSSVFYEDKYKMKPEFCKKCSSFYECGGMAKPYYDKYQDGEIKKLAKKHGYVQK